MSQYDEEFWGDEEAEDNDAVDYCYECGGYGNDYYTDDDGNLVCRCPECSMNPYWSSEYA